MRSKLEKFLANEVDYLEEAFERILKLSEVQGTDLVKETQNNLAEINKICKEVLDA